MMSHHVSVYVHLQTGQTGGMFRKRLTLHRQHIKNLNYAILGVSKHIADCARNIKQAPFLSLSHFAIIAPLDKATSRANRGENNYVVATSTE